MIDVPVTREQAALLRQALADAQAAQAKVALLATVLSAGKAPAGSELVAVKELAVTFRPPEVDDAA